MIKPFSPISMAERDKLAVSVVRALEEVREICDYMKVCPYVECCSGWFWEL